MSTVIEVERDERQFYTRLEVVAKRMGSTPGQLLASALREQQSVERVAATFKVTRSTVYRWMTRYGVKFVNRAAEE